MTEHVHEPEPANGARAPSRADSGARRASTQASLLALQQAAGNRAVAGRLNGIAAQRQPEGGAAAAPPPSPDGPVPLLVADATPDPLDPRQMRTGAFLAQVRTNVRDHVGPLVTMTPLGDDLDAQLDSYVAKYRSMTPAALEAEARREVPAAAGAPTAPALATAVAAHAAEQAKAQITAAVAGNDTSGEEGGTGGVVSSLVGGVVSMLFKGRDGATPRADAHPQAVRSALGSGRSLDTGPASALGSALGVDPSAVRVHTGAAAAGLADSMGARAFTVGNDIAFGSGEYQPGTLVGDALLAHELAHVAQQAGGVAPMTDSPGREGGHDELGLEEDADVAAAAAVMASRGAPGSLRELAGRVTPALRASLRVQRCSKDKDKPQVRLTNVRFEGFEPMTANFRDRQKAYGLKSVHRWDFDPPSTDPMKVLTAENLSAGDAPNPPFADASRKTGRDGISPGRREYNDFHTYNHAGLSPMDQLAPGKWTRHQIYEYAVMTGGDINSVEWIKFDEFDLDREVAKGKDGKWHFITTVRGEKGRGQADQVISDE